MCASPAPYDSIWANTTGGGLCPCARLLASDTVPATMMDRLRALAGTLDPLGLLDEIRAVQHHLAGLAAGSTAHPIPQRDADLDGFLRSLALAWRAGEVRPTHQPRKRPPRRWPTKRAGRGVLCCPSPLTATIRPLRN